MRYDEFVKKIYQLLQVMQ